MTIKRLPWLTLAVAGAVLSISIPQQAQALSLACCSSLDEMEKSSDLIIRGRSLLAIEDVEELHFSEAEYQTHQAAGKVLPPGASIIIHDGDWHVIRHYMTLPVEVLAVIEGETDNKVIRVVQHKDWGAIPMQKGSEYLLFLQGPSQRDVEQDLYGNFYGQGTYNLDGTDPRTSSASYYDAGAVKERYGDRVDFVSLPLPEKIGRSLRTVEKSIETTWVQRLIGRFRQWLAVN